MKIYTLHVKLTEPMLASSPADPEVYKRFIIERKKKEIENARTLEGETTKPLEELTADELETLSSGGREMSGWSVFHKDACGIFLFDYHVRGFMKAGAEAMMGKAGMSAYRSKIDKWLFVFPRRIYLRDAAGKNIPEAHGTLERPLRAMTMQGPRISLKRSDYVNEGTNFQCEVRVLDLGEKEFTVARLQEWVSYGQYSGFGEWRTGSYGRFEATLVEPDLS
jgi:hypothetical protein